MQFAILSDIHDNEANLTKALKWCSDNDIGTILCCGDMTNSDTLKYLAENFSGSITVIKGNCDLWHDEEAELYSNVDYIGRFGLVEADSLLIGMCHEPDFIPQLVVAAGKDGRQLDLIFYGHTHKPWESVEQGVRAINPGNISNTIFPATFAVYNTETSKAELKMLNMMN